MEGTRIRLTCNRLDTLDVLSGVGTHENRRGYGRNAGLKEVLVSCRAKLAQIVKDGFVLRAGAHLLERGDRHRGQEADDDDDNHDFNEGETLGLGLELLHGIWMIDDMRRLEVSFL